MKNNGFTLIELMVVIVIAGIMMAIVVPNITANLPYRRLTDGRMQVMADLSAVRQKSVSTDSAYGIVASATNLHVYQIYIDSNRDGAYASTEPVVKSVSLPSGVMFTAAFSVCFLPSGQLPSGMSATYATLVNNRGQRDSLLVMLSGAVFH